jgi:predicted Kef-type K+ transport protein
VRLLETIASTRLAAGLHRIGMTVLGRRTVVHRGAPLHRAVAIATVAIPTVTAVAVAALVAPERPIVAVGVAVGVVAARVTWCLMLRRGRLMLWRKPLVEHVVAAIVIAELVTVTRLAQALAVAVGHVARLLQLIAIGHDDAGVVLGMLQIILGQHRVAGRLRIARESEILLRDMCRRASDFYIRPVGFEAAR